MNTSPPQRPPREQARAYWRANLRLLAILLFIWFFVSYGCGILFVDILNQVKLPGTSFPLGFWFAQQGSIYVFLILIYVYMKKMRQLDEQFGFAED
jgi:putative solute:sodium symporter small subunit